MGASLKLVVNSLHDDLELRFMSRLKATALNSGVVRMLPWEAALFNKGDIAGSRTTCAVPGELLTDVVNVRDACTRLIGTGMCTFAGMRKSISPSIKQLLTLGKTIFLEFVFLCDHATIMATAQVHAAALEALPSEGTTGTFTQVLLDFERVKRLSACQAVGPMLVQELNGVISLVRGLSEGVGPAPDRVCSYSLFYKAVIKKCENFISSPERRREVKVDKRKF